MLLRSSSTPVLGSLIPDSSGHRHNHPPELATPTHHPQFKKFFLGSRRISCNSSPSSPSVSEISGKGFRKVLSEGNLEVLESPDRELKLALPVNGGLETIPSFSFRGSRAGYVDEESEGEEEEEEEIEGAGTEMCLVTGIGAGDGGSDCGGGGGGGGHRPVDFYGGAGDGHGFNIEEHYKKMLQENPSNPLFLRNYAQFLYQTKGDAKRAEEYYSRAILADPSDGEVLSQYAKLVWELHHDAPRATTYFQCAVQASSHDSHVQAAFAKFLWDIDDYDDDDEDDEPSDKANQVMTMQPGPAVPSAAAR